MAIFSRTNKKPILRALFIITPHALEPIAQDAFLQVHRKAIKAFSTLKDGTTRPHTYYSPEVDFGGFVSDSEKFFLEKGIDHFKGNKKVKEFVRHAADEAFQRNLPFKILSKERTKREVKEILALSKGSLTEREIEEILHDKTEQWRKGRLFNKLITSIEQKAQNEKGSERPNTKALQLNAWMNQDNAIKELVNAMWLNKAPVKPNEKGVREVRNIVSRATGHETILETLQRHLNEGHTKWSQVIPHFIVVDKNGELHIDEKLHELIPSLAEEIQARPVKNIKEIDLPDPYVDTQKTFKGFEDKAKQERKGVLAWLKNFFSG